MKFHERTVTYIARSTDNGAEMLVQRERNANEVQTPSARPADVRIRIANLADMRVVNELRNHYIATSTAIYADEPTPDDVFLKGFFENRDMSRHPIIVAEIAGQFAGYGMLLKHDDKCGYAATVENSVYVAPSFHRRGVGGALMSDLIDRAQAAGHRCILARIDTNQQASLALHLRYGFEPVGILRQAGLKFGQWLDVAMLQRAIESE